MDDDGSPYDADSDDALAGLTPEELQQLLNLGTAPDREQRLQQQLLQVQALRAGSGNRHSTPAGALLSGLADAGNAVIGGVRENHLYGKMDALSGQQVDARRMLLQRMLQRRQPEMGAGDVMPSGEFGLG